ncbi:PKHD-type hydroxylase [Acrasis kona]|uniref:PKHD-type hydroxylase n=1 Tax=Acrasis kona TaxID=1008807 RepID=A0AAW2YWM5_9EUKA
MYELRHTIDYFMNQVTQVLFEGEAKYLMCSSADSSIIVMDFNPKPYKVSNQVDKSIYNVNDHSYNGAPSKTWDICNIKSTNPKPVTRTDLSVPGAFLLHEVLSEEECAHFIKETEALQYEDCYGFHPSYRSNKRVIVNDIGLADLILERTKEFLPLQYEVEGEMWKAKCLNPQWRFCRYNPGQHFSAHIDGCYTLDMNNRSWFTFMIYLNGGFKGGSTNFLKKIDRDTKIVTCEVPPERGLVLVFPHHLLHEGEPLGNKQKYIMRSDLMFEKIHVKK